MIFGRKTMGVFWKKESCNYDSMYVNPFVSIEIEHHKDMKPWHDQLNALKSFERSQKHNIEADKFMQYGHTAFSIRNWNEALSAYNQALCFAESGTICEGLSYVNRGKCFFQLGLHHNALTDFKLAVQKMCPDQFLNDIHDLRVNCQKLAKKRHQTKTILPKMKLAANTQFPCMADVLKIECIKDYGRCVIANVDIDVGQTIFVNETFASVAVAQNQAYCYTCHCTDQMNFIPCVNCSDVMFCDEKCANNNSIHKMECQTSYHRIDNIDVKFIIQTVLVAIEMFASVDDLMKFVESCCTVDRDCDQIPKSGTDSISKYDIFLKLTPSHSDAHLLQAYQAYTCILLIPKIKHLFDTELKQRFLMQLIVHHSITIPKNVFRDTYSDQLSIEYIFDVLSMVNHSCAPNIHFSIEGKMGYGVSVRPIKKGEQVFINYFSGDLSMPTEKRQQILKDAWNFHCKCDKCEGGQSGQLYETMKSDPSLKYVIENFNPSQVGGTGKSQQLEQHCLKFLRKYGHLPCTNELELVINCFVSL